MRVNTFILLAFSLVHLTFALPIRHSFTHTAETIRHHHFKPQEPHIKGANSFTSDIGPSDADAMDHASVFTIQDKPAGFAAKENLSSQGQESSFAGYGPTTNPPDSVDGQGGGNAAIEVDRIGTARYPQGAGYSKSGFDQGTDARVLNIQKGKGRGDMIRREQGKEMNGKPVLFDGSGNVIDGNVIASIVGIGS